MPSYWCEVAQDKTEVMWYKDGKKLSASSKVCMEAKGCSRRLVVQQAGKADAGEYSCQAGGQKVSFHLDVTGQFLWDCHSLCGGDGIGLHPQPTMVLFPRDLMCSHGPFSQCPFPWLGQGRLGGKGMNRREIVLPETPSAVSTQ